MITAPAATWADMAAHETLLRPEGRLAFDIAGTGPLVICIPGMGDLRSVYRFLAPHLVLAGYRVATMDLRGHGDSDATFQTYDDVAAGTDLIALTRLLGGPAVLVGNSMGAGAAVWAAAEAPHDIAGLVLIAPFVRNPRQSLLMRWLFHLALMRPWGPWAWKMYYNKLYPGNPPVDLPEHQARIARSLGHSDRWRAFVATSHTDHTPAHIRLGTVMAPTMVVMGEWDPDFPHPKLEADYVTQQLTLSASTVVMVPRAGHYPQAEYPDVVSPTITHFLAEVVHHGQG